MDLRGWKPVGGVYAEADDLVVGALGEKAWGLQAVAEAGEKAHGLEELHAAGTVAKQIVEPMAAKFERIGIDRFWQG